MLEPTRKAASTSGMGETANGAVWHSVAIARRAALEHVWAGHAQPLSRSHSPPQAPGREHRRSLPLTTTLNDMQLASQPVSSNAAMSLSQFRSAEILTQESKSSVYPLHLTMYSVSPTSLYATCRRAISAAWSPDSS